MSKFQLRCSCIHCHTETTFQSLTHHIKKCTQVFKNACEYCGAGTNNDRFCSRSCRARVVNVERASNKPTPKSRTELGMEKFLAGKITERSALRKYLAVTQGYKCNTCNVSEWQDKPITLIVDHIDGNASDNHPSNLRLICPNCNSQTDTFGGRNKGNGRKCRGLPLH